MSSGSAEYRGEGIDNYFARAGDLDPAAAEWLARRTGRSAGWIMFGEPEPGKGEASAFREGRRQALAEMAEALERLSGISPAWVPEAAGGASRAQKARKVVEQKRSAEPPSPSKGAQRRQGRG